MKLTGKRFLVMLLYSPTEGTQVNASISGRTRLMKMGFLFREELLKDFIKDTSFDEIKLPEYYAWKYGPFSRDLLNDLEFLINQEYVDVEYSKNQPMPEELAEYDHWIGDLNDFDSSEYSEEVFRLAKPKGLSKGKELWGNLSENQRKLLKEFKRSLVEVSLDRILLYVYRNYKKYTDKSLIRERYLY